MRSPVIDVATHAPLEAARALFESRDISSVLVRDVRGAAVGVISRSDLLRIAATNTQEIVVVDLADSRVRDVMARGVVTVSSECEVAAAAREMVERHIHRVYVEVDGEVRGVFGTRDAMAAMIERRLADPISAFMSAPVLSVQFDEPIGRAIAQFKVSHVSGLVVQEGEWPVGLFTQREALEARSMSPTAPVEQVMTASLVCLQADTPLHRAAALSVATRARRVLALEGRRVVGLLTGLDFCRALAASGPRGGSAASDVSVP